MALELFSIPLPLALHIHDTIPTYLTEERNKLKSPDLDFDDGDEDMKLQVSFCLLKQTLLLLLLLFHLIQIALKILETYFLISKLC
jgi:hypothetical protein